MNIMEEPDRFFFAGNLIKCVDFDPYEALATSDYYPTHLLYIKEKMQLFVTLKNNIQIWDILTGRIVDTFTRQTEN